MTRRLALLLLPLMLTGCGTKVFTHEVTIAFDDPSGRLGDGPVEVSLFDRQMGESEEWARKTIGTASPAAPFRTTASRTATVMVGESGPRPRVEGGLYVPALERRGYFALALDAVEGRAQEVNAPFVPFYDFPADAPKPAPLAIRATSEAGAEGWRIALRVQVAGAAD